jgi:hypothetical protein
MPDIPRAGESRRDGTLGPVGSADPHASSATDLL